MAISKVKTGWRLDIQPSSSSPRIRKILKTKAEALHHQRLIQDRHHKGLELKPKKDTRNLSELIALYHDLCGQHLKSHRDRLRSLLRLCEVSGDPPAYQLTPHWFAELRSLRAKTVSPSTLNHDRAYLHALFSELSRLGHWSLPNPVSTSRKVKQPNKELTFLTVDQIQVLLHELARSTNPHVYLIAVVCLSTGARWSEAESLTPSQIGDGLLSFWNTKTGISRHIPITKQLHHALINHPRHGLNRLFSGSYAAFRNAVDRIGLELPDGQLTHVLRHTFASHFVQRGGNLLELQKILGHTSITMTMRYAHLAPGHLENAKRLNPLSAETTLTLF